MGFAVVRVRADTISCLPAADNEAIESTVLSGIGEI